MATNRQPATISNRDTRSRNVFDLRTYSYECGLTVCAIIFFTLMFGLATYYIIAFICIEINERGGNGTNMENVSKPFKEGNYLILDGFQLVWGYGPHPDEAKRQNDTNNKQTIHYDGAAFNIVRARIWDALRETFPDTPDLQSVMQCTMNDGQEVTDYIFRVQEMWRAEMGTLYDQSTSLFYFIIKRGLPKEVQKALDKIAGIEAKG